MFYKLILTDTPSGIHILRVTFVVVTLTLVTLVVLAVILVGLFHGVTGVVALVVTLVVALVIHIFQSQFIAKVVQPTCTNCCKSGPHRTSAANQQNWDCCKPIKADQKV